MVGYRRCIWSGGKGLWPQNTKKDLWFEIDGAGVDLTVHLRLQMPPRGQRLTTMHRLIRPRAREFPSAFRPSSFRWAAPR
jgi:hypothetical protein